MYRKSQNTIFIIVGLLIFLSIILLFHVLNTAININDPLPAALENSRIVETYVQRCLEEAAKDTIIKIGEQGGYIDPFYYKDNMFYKRSYLYYNELPYVPSKEIMEEEISTDIDLRMQYCADQSVFEKLGINASVGRPETKTILSNETVTVVTSYPITVFTGMAASEISSFSTEVRCRLGHIRDSVEGIVFNSLLDPDYIDYTYLENLDFNITVRSDGFDTIEYSFVDEKIKLENRPYLFAFYEKYNTSFIYTDNEAPRILEVPDLDAYAGEFFHYQIPVEDPEDDPLAFEADTLLFEITDEGYIMFVPDAYYIGEHLVPVYVRDNHGNRDIATLKIIIHGER